MKNDSRTTHILNYLTSKPKLFSYWFQSRVVKMLTWLVPAELIVAYG